ncbi:MAG: helix-turn-helix domain-containing protein [Bacteroidales bacterium]|nr:MAG: helix-turn-helix domain-containing protein [Bacteroidales bacterium]
MQNEINDTKQDYFKRINNVISFVEKNLDKDLHLDDLSKKAFFSLFHFHRIFSAIVGETLNSLIIRKRIERIASIIAVGTNETFVDLAYKYGFSSASSFSRAFKKFYGISPTDFKEKKKKNNISKIGKGSISYEQYICSIDNILNWLNMNAQIEVKELPEIKLAGIMHIGKPDKIGYTYERLFKWAYSKGIANFHDFKAVTIYHDNPRITETSKVRQSACIKINGEFSTDYDIVKLVIQKGKFAVGHFEITPIQFQKAWESMCVWVIENGHIFRDGDYFEIYHNDYRTHPEQKFIVDICIPIETGKGKNIHSDKTEKSLNDYKKDYKRQIEIGNIPKAYKGLMGFMKNLRTYFVNNYLVDYVIGSIYSGDMTITYFPFTPKTLKEQKLKIAIVFNHQKIRFEIWLAGQNKQIQKKYWEIFKDSDWKNYHIPLTIDEGFSIADNILVENPNFDDLEVLTEQIETKTMEFIKEIMQALE